MSSEEMVNKGVSIEDDMDDDFDDLLEKFNHPTETKVEEPQVQKPIANSANITTKPTTTDETKNWTSPELGDDFAQDLAEGMEALLAGMNQEDGGEFQKHLEALVSGNSSLTGAADLLEALRQTEASSSTTVPSTSFSSSSSSNQSNINQNQNVPHVPDPESKNFQEAILETMEKLKKSEDSAKAKSGPSGTENEDEQLSALFEKMLSGGNGLPDENQLQTILQSFMEELMSKEIMYEPLKDMNRLFPDWIKENRTKLSSEDFERYQIQSKIIEQVIQKFEDPSWDSDEKIGGENFISRQKEVIDLLTKMQDCGPPPKEILGNMPAGVLGEDGLPNPEQCLIS